MYSNSDFSTGYIVSVQFLYVIYRKGHLGVLLILNLFIKILLRSNIYFTFLHFISGYLMTFST